MVRFPTRCGSASLQRSRKYSANSEEVENKNDLQLYSFLYSMKNLILNEYKYYIIMNDIKINQVYFQIPHTFLSALEWIDRHDVMLRKFVNLMEYVSA